jgi:hypothetical protein
MAAVVLLPALTRGRRRLLGPQMDQWARVLLGWRGMERWKGGGGIVSIATGVARGVHGSGVRPGNGGGSVVACPD